MAVVRIVARSNVMAYAGLHPIAAPSLRYWLTVTSNARWRSMNDVTRSFANCKTLGADRVRFEVAGGRHRMIVSFSFAGQACWIKFLGTHEEYDAIDAHKVSMF